MQKGIKLNLKKPIVLCVAAFLPYKRIHLLIEAVAKLDKGSLLVIGQGPLEHELRDVGQKLLADRFQVITGITHEHLLKYYKGVEVFSLPSDSSEALGIVYIEAMAAGLPLVVPNDEHRRSLIGRAGIYIDPLNSDDYANGLKKAFQIKSSVGSLNQAEKFSWEEIVTQYGHALSNL